MRDNTHPTFEDLFETFKECTIVLIFENKRLQKKIKELEIQLSVRECKK